MNNVFWAIGNLVCGREGPNQVPWSPSEFKKHGIDTVLSLNDARGVDVAELHSAGLNYKCVTIPPFSPVEEGGFVKCMEKLKFAYEFLCLEISQHRKTLIHCRHGKDRTSLLIAYTLKHLYGYSSSEAFDYIRSIRPQAFTAFGWEEFSKKILNNEEEPIVGSVDVDNYEIINVGNISSYIKVAASYINTWKPNIVIACDSGARIFGLALYKYFSKHHGKLPTNDGCIRFRKISGSEDAELNLFHLNDVITEINTKQLDRVLIIDDWVHKGRTINFIKNNFKKSLSPSVEVRFGVLVGKKTDFFCMPNNHKDLMGIVEWHNKDDLIGIKYKNFIPIISSGIDHREYRKKLYKALINND